MSLFSSKTHLDRARGDAASADAAQESVVLNHRHNHRELRPLKHSGLWHSVPDSDEKVVHCCRYGTLLAWPFGRSPSVPVVVRALKHDQNGRVFIVNVAIEIADWQTRSSHTQEEW